MHTPLRWLAALLLPVLEWAGLPGALTALTLTLVARLTARRPQLSGKWPDGRGRAEGVQERAQEAAWRRATDWMSGGLLPTGADACPAVALAALAWACQTRDPQDVGLPAWRFALAGVDALCAYLLCMAWFQQRRAASGTVRGLDTNMRRRRVPWAKSRLGQVGVCAAVGFVCGLEAWAFTGRAWPMVALAALMAGLPMIPAHRQAAKSFRLDLDTAVRLTSWLDLTPAKSLRTGRIGGVSDTRTGADGSVLAVLACRDAGEWADDGLRRALTPVTQADGRMTAIVYMGADRTRCRLAVVPSQPPAPDALLADGVMLAARMLVDETRMGAMYGAYAGDIADLRCVARHDGRPVVWSFGLDGTNADWDLISRDWLKDAAPGAFGDWMNMDGVRVVADPGGHGWVGPDAPWEGFDWEKGVGSLLCRNVTRRTDPERYFRLLDEEADLRATFAAALDTAKLPEPMSVWHDTAEDLRAHGWSIHTVMIAIPQGYDGGDYRRLDYRGAFAESRIADLLPVTDRDGRVSPRRLLFVHAPTVGAPGNARIPDTLRDLTGDDEAATLVARVIASRALGQLFKHPPAVVDARQCGRRQSVWRISIRLDRDVTAADLRKGADRLRTLTGADETLWDWRDANTVDWWAGGPFDDRETMWRDVRDRERMIRLRLDEAWAASRATGADGRPVSVRDIEPGGGALVRAVFDLPAGLGVDGALMKLDAFRATAGYRYARPIPGPGLTLLLGRDDPLPASAMADWNALDGGMEDTALPFAVGDDGGTVAFDPSDTPHLLISGQTMSGKTSAAVTIVNAALRRGWMVMVADPVKNGNDFAPVRSKCAGFATGLDRTAAMLRWVDEEGRRRRDLQTARGAANREALDPSERPPRLLVFVDEFVSLVELSKGAKRNPSGDPDVDNENILEAWRDQCRRMIGTAVSHILTQHRSQGITLVLGSQMLKTSSLDALPDAGLAKGQLGRMFIGSGQTAGQVSDVNVADANRLISQALEAGGMPKGRGLYERMGRGVQMVQCWWCGTADDITAHMADVPDREPVDWSMYVPERPRLVGVVDEAAEPVETVAASLADDDEWVLD